MGKVLSRSKKSKQKRRISQSKKCPKRNKGSESESASGGGGCMDLGKKRVAIFDENHVILSSPERLRYAAGPPVDLFKENNSLPSTPRPDIGVIDYESRFESLPMELLVKILCHMHHDQLKAVFHVSERIRTAVIVARRFHFNYTTPDRSRQEMLNTMTPLPTQHWPFVSKEDEKRKVLTLPRTPKAPRWQLFYSRSRHFHRGTPFHLHCPNPNADHFLPTECCLMKNLSFVTLLLRINFSSNYINLYYMHVQLRFLFIGSYHSRWLL